MKGVCASKDSTRALRHKHSPAELTVAWRTSAVFNGRIGSRSSLPEAEKGVYCLLTLWKKLPGRNDRRGDTTSVAGPAPTIRVLRNQRVTEK